RAVIGAAEEMDAPVIVNHAQVHQSVMDIRIIGPLMVEYAEAARVPVCVHIDHGFDKGYVLNAIRLGFTSVMYDRSSLPYERNLAETAEFVRDAHLMDVTVEAELGIMPGVNEPGGGNERYIAQSPDNLTDVGQAGEFVEKTGVDALAVSIGSVHCVLRDEVDLKLDINRLRSLDAATGNCCLVMHGGSGVRDDQIRLAIANGISKINFYTWMGIAPAPEIAKFIAANTDGKVYFHDIANLAQAVMKERCKQAIQVFLNR
ncbi:MAG: class II fructose-bisphosphate aldolase, partial [Planctomycetota bacterium]|nr:class II fructose-bisphosphate aldolase [Planctomycetota bacterium]